MGGYHIENVFFSVVSIRQITGSSGGFCAWICHVFRFLVFSAPLSCFPELSHFPGEEVEWEVVRESFVIPTNSMERS